MRALDVGAILVVPLVGAFVACSGGSGATPGEDAGVTDVPPLDASIDAEPGVPNTTITTLTAAPTRQPFNATLVAVTEDAASWKVLSPASPGTYAFEAKAAWTALVVCAGSPTESAHIALFARPLEAKKLEVTLEDYCLPTPEKPSRTLTGKLTNVPATSGWVDFAYARSVRGSIAAITGTSLDYEVVNIAHGTWDLAFGVRDDASSTLTRVAIRRNEVVDADKQLDIDLASALPAGTKKLDVNGIVVGDATTFTVAYAMNAERGLDLGPPLIPDQPSVSTTYLTIPSSIGKDADRYLGTLVAQSDGNRISREVLFSIKTPIDIDVTFPAALAAPPDVKIAKAEPHLRLETSFAVPANAASYEIVAVGKPTGNTVRVWSVSLPRGTPLVSSKIVYTFPDLAMIPGWMSGWTLPNTTIDVTASVHENEKPLGDGKVERVSRYTKDFTP